MYAMSGARWTSCRLGAVVLVACATILALPLLGAAVVVGTPTTTLSNTVTGLPSNYTFAGYANNKNRQLSWATITFPAGTDVSGATAVLTGTTVTVTGPTTVRVTYSPRTPSGAAFTIAVGNIVNPAAGTYPANSIAIVCRTTNNGGAQALDEPVATGGYAIVPTQFLTLTITTPGAGQSVEFGNIDPELTTPPQTVAIQVDSSAPYTFSRTITDPAPLGLAITGTPAGAKPAGTATYMDNFTLTPPLTVTPSVPLTATVLYTVVQ